MEKNKTEAKLNRSEDKAALWDQFEKTGSVKAFLLYSQKMEKTEENRETDSPT